MRRRSAAAAELIDHVRLARAEGVGPVAFRRLLIRYGSARSAIEALPQLARAGGRAGAPMVPGEEGVVQELGVSPASQFCVFDSNGSCGEMDIRCSSPRPASRTSDDCRRVSRGSLNFMISSLMDHWVRRTDYVRHVDCRGIRDEGWVEGCWAGYIPGVYVITTN